MNSSTDETTVEYIPTVLEKIFTVCIFLFGGVLPFVMLFSGLFRTEEIQKELQAPKEPLDWKMAITRVIPLTLGVHVVVFFLFLYCFTVPAFFYTMGVVGLLNVLLVIFLKYSHGRLPGRRNKDLV